MIITMKKLAPQEEIDRMVRSIEMKGLQVTMISGTDYNVFGVVGDTTILDDRKLSASPYVDNVQRVSAPYKLANRVFHPADTVVDVSGVRIGGSEPIVVMAGPCSIESEAQIDQIAELVHSARATRAA